MRVSQLFVHPVKSCAAVPVREVAFTRRGPAWDRAWMVVEADTGAMVSARHDPSLARVAAQVVGTQLHVGPVDGPVALKLPVAQDGPRRRVTVWKHDGPGLDCGDEAAAFFSEVVQREVRLVRTPPEHERFANEDRAPGSEVSFADGYPVLVLTEASLAGLADRWGQPADVRRFRPNVVIAGAGAHAEDDWLSVRAGGVTLTWAKPCERCVMVNVDPDTGVGTGGEPLKTLASYRRDADHGILFAANYACTDGVIRVGDAVTVLATR